MSECSQVFDRSREDSNSKILLSAIWKLELEKNCYKLTTVCLVRNSSMADMNFAKYS